VKNPKHPRQSSAANKEVEPNPISNEQKDTEEGEKSEATEDDEEEEGVEEEVEDDEKKTQYKIKPAQIPSWEESGQDINIGVIVPAQSYDEDDPVIGNQMSEAEGSENVEQQTPQKESVTGIEIDSEILAQEERVRKMKKAKQELQKTLEQIDADLIKKAYQFFKHDENKTSINIEDRIHQDGAVRSYQQHQAYAIFWMMWVERHGTPDQQGVALGGGILGDEPGFGKVGFSSFLPRGLF
jgi:hypothetical protein